MSGKPLNVLFKQAVSGAQAYASAWQDVAPTLGAIPGSCCADREGRWAHA